MRQMFAHGSARTVTHASNRRIEAAETRLQVTNSKGAMIDPGGLSTVSSAFVAQNKALPPWPMD